MNKPLTIALAGLGTVGGNVARQLQDNANLLAARAGRLLRLVAASARHKEKCPTGIKFVPDARDLVKEAELVVEVIGGTTLAGELISAALAQKLPVVTANKALLAARGAALAAQAEEQNTELRYEAAVMAAVPVIRALREGLASNHITQLCGIVNGSTNYMLTAMTERGQTYAEAEAEAKQLGYLEADPSLDVDGHDAAQKLTLLAALAFGTVPDEEAVATRGIRTVTPAHLKAAAAAGFVLKLIARATPEGMSVGPMLVPPSSPLARIGCSQNGLLVETKEAGSFSFLGAGAGGAATASGVLADVIDLARGNRQLVFGVRVAALRPAPRPKNKENSEFSADLPYPVLSTA